MICQACRTYEWTGASLINCPSCDATIGKTPELPEPEPKPKQNTPKKMYFWEVKDKTTGNAVVYHFKAQSEPDAKKGLLQHYRQVGITKYTINRISASSMTDEEIRKICEYYVRKRNGDVEKRPVKR